MANRATGFRDKLVTQTVTLRGFKRCFNGSACLRPLTELIPKRLIHSRVTPLYTFLLFYFVHLLGVRSYFAVGGMAFLILVCKEYANSPEIQNNKSPIYLIIKLVGDLFCGTTRNRTKDTRIFSPLLYQLSYGTVSVCKSLVFETAKIEIIFYRTIATTKKICTILNFTALVLDRRRLGNLK